MPVGGKLMLKGGLQVKVRAAAAAAAAACQLLCSNRLLGGSAVLRPPSCPAGLCRAAAHAIAVVLPCTPAKSHHLPPHAA